MEMRKFGYLAMKTEQMSSDLVQADFKELGFAAMKLANDAFMLESGLGFGTTFFKFLSSFAAIYLLILGRTNWKSNILIALLVPYLFMSLPSVLFGLLRSEVGMCISSTVLMVQLFFPRLLPEWLMLPGTLGFLAVMAPSFLADSVRGGIGGAIICLIIGCFLLQQHIRASGGFRNSFAKGNGVSNSVGIILLFVYPVWGLVVSFL